MIYCSICIGLKIVFRSLFSLRKPLIYWLLGQCLIYSAYADPPSNMVDFTKPDPTFNETNPPPDSNVRPQRQLQIHRENLVPIPDMADIPPETDSPPIHPPLKVTIPDMEALRKLHRHMPLAPAGSNNELVVRSPQMLPDNTSQMSPPIVTTQTIAAPVTVVHQTVPVELIIHPATIAPPTPLPRLPASPSEKKSTTVYNETPRTRYIQQEPVYIATHPSPTVTAVMPFPKTPSSPMATVAADPITAVTVTNEPEPLPAYARPRQQQSSYASADHNAARNAASLQALYAQEDEPPHAQINRKSG